MKSYTVQRIDLTQDEIEILVKVRKWASEFSNSTEFENAGPSVQEAIYDILDSVETLFDRVEWDSDLSEI